MQMFLAPWKTEGNASLPGDGVRQRVVGLEIHPCNMGTPGKRKGSVPGIVSWGRGQHKDLRSSPGRCKKLPIASCCKFCTALAESLSGTRLGPDHAGPPVWAGVRIAFGSLQ